MQMENGCICCTLRDDLVRELAALARQGELDHIVVESTGVSEPLPVAQTFSAPIAPPQQAPAALDGGNDEDPHSAGSAAPGHPLAGLRSLNDVAHLHALVTVADCSTFLAHLASLDDLKDLGMGTSPEDARPLAFLLAEQVQFADTVLVNKTDLVTPAEAGKVEGLLRRLNPHAELQPVGKLHHCRGTHLLCFTTTALALPQLLDS